VSVLSRIEGAVTAARDAKRIDRLVAALAAARTTAKLSQPIEHHRMFGQVSDYQWFWLNTVGYRRFSFLRELLPGLPDPTLQRGWVGKSGDRALREGFHVYRACKLLCEKYDVPIRPESRVLDFGCGWGRVLRFFMRDVLPGNLYGVDVMPFSIQVCQATNSWGQFTLIDGQPPTSLPSGSFDLIYLVSVFSHLPEKTTDAWVSEFHRLLKPGGLLVTTTWPRSYIEDCERCRTGEVANAHEGALLAFKGTAEWQGRYDRGEFCHSPTGGGKMLDAAVYGETCIPEAYARTKWADRFEIREYIQGHPWVYQDIIVAQNKAER
jgi:SAM-dependent methyltransferase